MKKRKSKKKTTEKVLYISIFTIISYTIAAFSLQFYGNIEISPTLTTCFFAFFTVEIFNLTSIKKSKIKNNYTDTNNANEESSSNNTNG